MLKSGKPPHVLAKLRKDLGLRQKELARKVLCHYRTIQDVEHGKLRLSRILAMRISEKTGVSVDWLLKNDPKRDIVNCSGRRWSNKDRKLFEDRQKRWADLLPAIRKWRVLVCMELLKDYLRLRSLIETLPEPGKALIHWGNWRREAFLKFLETYKPISAQFGFNPKELTVSDYESFTVSASNEALQSIQGDVEAVLEALKYRSEAGNSKEVFAHLFVELGGNDPYDVLEALNELSDKDLEKQTLGEIKRRIGGSLTHLPQKKQRSSAKRPA